MGCWLKILLSAATTNLLVAGVSFDGHAAEISGAVRVTSQGNMTYRAGLGSAWDKS